MAIRQTFHTPSFGDEEFEILSAPTFDHQQQQQQHQHQQQSLLLQRQSNVNTIEQSSSSSLHSIVPAVTNQSTNQWQTHTTDSGYFENSVAMEDAAIMPTDEGDANSVTIATALTKTKKKRESNEPTKPISAYALFFRDTQAAIKGQNPDASFEEISKIVASMWDALDPEHKNVYKKKTELAKKEYLKLLAVYRASQINKEEESDDNVNAEEDEIQNNTNAINSVSNNSTFIQEDTSASTATVPTQSNTQSINSSNSEKISTPIGNNQPSLTEIPLRQNNNNFLTDSNDIASVSRNHSTNIVETNQQLQKCIREGCSNKAIINPDWEDEYCSNECVIIHCRDVFSQWIQSNLQQPNLQQSNLQTA